MSDIDIKGMTDKLETGDGCSLKFAMQQMHFNEQEGVFDKLSTEANGRPGNHLDFVKRTIDVVFPNGQPTGDKIPVLDIKNDGQIIFEVFKSPGSEQIQGICKFGGSDKK